MTLTIPSLADLPAAAVAFMPILNTHPVVAFHGSMGAGKTTFIAALCRALGVEEAVTSPTFAIVNEYAAPGAAYPVIYHFDFYRLRTPEEAYAIGLDEYLASGNPCLMEWPDIVADILPPDALHVHLQEKDGVRTLEF